MDPTALLKDTLESLISAHDNPPRPGSIGGHAQDAIDGLRDLADWLEKGGFPPDVDEVIDDLQETTP